jgi:UDP-glucuronate 4-epimerase
VPDPSLKRVLVTGGAGFIGSNLAGRLLAGGVAVRVLDCFDPFYAESVKRRNLDRVRAGENGSALELIEGDIRDAEACARATDGVDAVVHLAALAGVRPSIKDPRRYMDVNVTGTQTLLEAIRGRPEVRFVFGSSSSVYGGNEKVPFAEDDLVDWPISPYAASKKAGEVVCHAHHHLHGNPITCLRFFTVYGPGQRPDLAIHLFSRKLIDGESIPMFGDGTTSRDYTFVEDIVDGILGALQRTNDSVGGGYRVYNLGGSQPIELRALIAALEKATGREAKIERKPEQPGDVPRTWADVGRAEAELGYRPNVSIEQGLERFVAWFRKEREAGVL